MPIEANRRFTVRALHEDVRQEHALQGGSFEDAALLFFGTWSPALDADGEITVMVTDCETGHRQCLRVDVRSGAIAACD